MEDNVESPVVSGKPKSSSKTLEVVSFYTDSPRVFASDTLRLDTGSKISKRIRSSLARSFSAKNRTSGNGSGSGGGHENRVLKKSPSLSEGIHGEAPGISGSGSLGALNNVCGLLKKKRGLLKRKHAKNSWASDGNCGIRDLGFSEGVKGKNVSWIRKVGFSSALKSDGVDVGRSKKRKGRKEISLSCFEPVLKKRKSGNNGVFCFNSNGPALKRSRSRVVVAKKPIGCGTTDDPNNLDQLSDASKGVSGINGSAEKYGMDSTPGDNHLEDGAASSCRNRGLKPIESSKPKNLSSPVTSVRSKNRSKGQLVNSKDESRPLIHSLLNKRRKILNKVKKDESGRCASVPSLNDDAGSSVLEKLSSSIRKRQVSAKDGMAHVEMKPLYENPHENNKDISSLGSDHVEPSVERDINDVQQDVNHSFKVSQDHADEGSGRTLPFDLKENEAKNSLKVVEELSSVDADVQKVEKYAKTSQENLDVGLESVEDSSNLSSSQADEQENLEQNAAQMLSSRFNSSCSNFVGNDSHSAQQSANGSLFSILFHRNFKNASSNSLVRRKVSAADSPDRILRPRKQKQKHFIKRRRRFVEVRYRESDAYSVLNRKVKVFWPLDEQWYFGEIKNYNPKSKLHYIQYDDRDEEWLSLGKERFKLLLHESELDDHAGCPYDSHDLEGEHVNVEQDFHSTVDESKGPFLDSEPIISWLARSSSRGSSSSLGIMKMQKKSSVSGCDLASCVPSRDSVFNKRKEQPVFALRMNEHNKLVPGFVSEDRSFPLQVNDAAHRDDVKKNELVQFDSISNKRKAPVVYFRKRFRRGKEHLPCIVEEEPSSGSALGSVRFLASVADRVDALEGLKLLPFSDEEAKKLSSEDRPLASQSLLQTAQNPNQASAGSGAPLDSTKNFLHQGFSDLKLENSMSSEFTSGLIKLDHIRLILSIPSHWVFSPRAMAKDSEFFSAFLLLNFGEINPVWPKVYLEMMIINKVVALNILLFEGCLGHAVTLLCSILSSFCAPQVSADSLSPMEFKSVTDLQLPFIYIKFKLLGDEGKQALFVFYSVLKIQTSSWKDIHGSDDKLISGCESLPSAELADADARLLQSTICPMGSSALEKLRNSEGFTHQANYMPCYEMPGSSVPGILAENLRSLSAIALSFAAAPTFFLSLHVKLMMANAIASTILQNDFSQKHSGRRKKILIKRKDGLVIQPSSRLMNPQTTGLQLLAPEHVKVGVSDGLSITGAGHWLKSKQKPSNSMLKATGTPIGVKGLRKDPPTDDAHCRTVIRLRRYPCNMGSWQYAGRSRSSASIVPPLSADTDPSCVSSSLTTVDDQIASPSSQLTSSPFERAVGSIKISGGELVGNIQDGNFRQQSTTAPRSMSNSNRLKSARKSFSFRSKSWQEGRSGFLYSQFVGGSWKNQSLGSGSSPCEDGGSYRHGRLLKQDNDDELRRGLGNSASPRRFLDSLSCDANVLVTIGDRGWRECAAQVMLACLDHNDWRLLVKIKGSIRYSYKAHQLLQPGVTNRSNHAIIWKGGKDWSLEFVNRSDYILFKEMHEECYNRNIRAASVKNIPIPGVRMIEEDEASHTAVPFVRGLRYFRQVESEIEMALDPARVLYDMDDEDEEWLTQFQKSLDIDESHTVDVSDEMFERAMDAFEKAAYAQQREEFSLDEIERITSDVGPFDVLEAMYEHWRMNRRNKGIPLIRQFQPPLWEQYQQQLKEWESAMSKLHNSSNGCTGKGDLIEKPPMFAFCLRPRGLEVPNKGSKQRSQRRFPAVGYNNVYPRELESCPFNGRKMNGSTVGDERAVNSYSTYDCSDVSPRFHAYSGLSPKYASYSGPSPRNSDWSDLNQSPRVFVPSKKMGVFVPSSGYASPSMIRRNGLLHLRRPAPSKWLNKKHYQSDGSSMEQTSDQSGSTDREEMRFRDPVSAAERASDIARLKRLKAQRLLQKADLTLHKAMVALVTAELIQAAENDSDGNG